MSENNPKPITPRNNQNLLVAFVLGAFFVLVFGFSTAGTVLVDQFGNLINMYDNNNAAANTNINYSVPVAITSPLNNASTAIIIESILKDTALPGLIPTVEVDHWANHEGLLDTTFFNMTMTASSERKFMWCNSETTHFHLINMHLGADAGPVRIEFYEAPSITNNGTLTNMTRMNRETDINRTIGYTYYTDTITSNDGTLLTTDWLLGTNNRANDIFNLPNEWIFEHNICYLVKIVNENGNGVFVHGSFSGIDVPGH